MDTHPTDIMRARGACLALLAWLVLSDGWSVAAAQTAEPDKVPITVNTCAFGVEPDADNSKLGFGVEFTNTSDRVVSDVRFHFIFMSKFNEPLLSADTTDSGVFSPGAQIDHRRKDIGKQLMFGGGKPLATYYWRGDKIPHR